MSRLTLLCLLFIGIASSGLAQNDADRILGIRVTGKGNARVKIEKIGNRYFGKTVWLEEPTDPETGKPKTDTENPDPSLRNMPRLGLRIMKDFEFIGENKWKEGTVYDPENGKTYCGAITWVDNNTIELRGHICGLSFLGRSDTWKRYTP